VIQAVVAGSGVAVNNTDPTRPVVSSTERSLRNAVSFTIPASAIDSTSTGAFTDWLTTNCTVPTWATVAIIQTSVTGIYEATGASLPYGMQLRLGTQVGIPANANARGANVRFSESWGEMFTLTTRGVVALAVQVSRPSGGGGIRFDSASRAFFDITFALL
jgi:hypothetical protein